MARKSKMIPLTPEPTIYYDEETNEMVCRFPVCDSPPLSSTKRSRTLARSDRIQGTSATYKGLPVAAIWHFVVPKTNPRTADDLGGEEYNYDT